MTLAGVDGCRGGWLCVSEHEGTLNAFVIASFPELVERLAAAAIIAIDVPIGLTDAGPRACDVEARRLLGRPRASSVFAAPVRAALSASTYEDACLLHERADGRKLSRQTFGILPKIAEVDCVLRCDTALQARIREVHPEVCFAIWNGGSAMRERKSLAAGRTERERLIESAWPRVRPSLGDSLRGQAFGADDLNDALAALWTARRISQKQARVFPNLPLTDSFGFRMEIVA